MRTYGERVDELEKQGLCTSDAQAVVDAEDLKLEPPVKPDHGEGRQRLQQGQV
jgi:hypothetical protein